MAGDFYRQFHILILLSLSTFSVAFGFASSFEDGHDYWYTYSAASNILGVQNITTVVKIRIRHINETSSGSLNQLFVESVFQRTEQGYASDNPLNWVLTRPFLFHRNDSGEIRFVHYDHEDENEVVNLKKALTSVFSFNMQVRHQPVWSYAANETDHSGSRTHRYFAERLHDNAIHLKRYHSSITDAERHQEKHINLSPQNEVREIKAEDKVLLKDKLPKKPNRKPDPSEFVFEGRGFGEFPDIHSSSNVQVTLNHKTRHNEQPTYHQGLKEDSIVVFPSPPKKVALSDVFDNITSSLQCIRESTNKYAPRRTECVHQLKRYLEQLETKDVVTIVGNTLNDTCREEDVKCQDDRFLFIDMLCQLGTMETQSLIIHYVLNVSNVHSEEVRRVLFHYVGLKNPTAETVTAVWNLCFGPNKEKHGTQNNTKDTHNSCLTLGALARTLSASNFSVASRIVVGLSSWLGHHDGSKVEHARVRIRREIIPPRNETEENHRISKMVLIEALGNTGHQKALDHIITYIRPNVGHSAWRRSGIHALRWFSCKKSASALIDASINDDHDLVREHAFDMYQKHPMRRNMSEEEKNAIFSKRYTYPIVMHSRSKRGSLADLLKKLSFKLELPGIDWSKTIGSSSIGASFGLIIRNRLELELKPLSGFFEIDIYNTAFVKALLGIVGVEFDILNAKACYQGHIRYDLNVLKDFGVNDIKDLAKIFDKILATVRDPIVKAIEQFKNVFKLLKGKGVKGIVQDLVDIVRNFPNRVKLLIDKITAFAKTVSDYDGLPWVKSVKNVIFRVKYFIEDVKNDIMNFYNSVIDPITVTMPFIARNLVDSIKMAVDSVKNIFKNPLQSIQAIGKAILNIKMSISMFIGAKNKIEEASLFRNGKLPYWMNPGAEFKDLVEDVKIAFKEVTALLKRLGDNIRENIDLRVGQGDGLITQIEQEIKIGRKLIEMLKDTLNPLEELRAIAQPFIDAYNSIFDVIKGIKKAYFDLKTAVQKARALIQKVFGPKFHIRFPSFRVDCDESNCACGTFPSNVDNRFQNGLDLLVAKDVTLRSPVVGLVKKRNNNEVLIEPAAGAFEEYQIIISNVKPLAKITNAGIVIKAGKPIGKVGSSQCSPSFIHVAMRKIPTGEGTPASDDDYAYVDPTPFVERILPVPRWIEDCKEYSLIFLGQTVEKGDTVGGGKTSKEEIERAAEEQINSAAITEEEPPVDLTYRPPDVDDQTTQTLSDNFREQVAPFKDLKQLFNKNSESSNLLSALNVNKITLGKIMRILDNGGLNAKIAKIRALIEGLSTFLKRQPIQHPSSFSPRALRNLLQRRNLPDSGSFQKMIRRYITFPNGVCSNIGAGVGTGSGLFCTPHTDCLGLTCGIPFQLHFLNKVVKLDVRLNACADTIDVTFGNYHNSIAIKNRVIDFDLPSFGFAEMKATGTLTIGIEQNKVEVTLEATLCSLFYPTCTQTMKLLKDIQLTKPSTPCLTGPENDGTFDQVMDMKLQYFVDQVLDANIGVRKEVLNFVNELRVATLDALLSNPESVLEILGTSFPDKTDFCVSGDIPIKPRDVTFFKYNVFFTIGPVPMRLSLGAGGSMGLTLEVGACLLSMTGFVKTTPFIGAKVWGSLSVDIGIAAAGLELVGYLLETRFPITGTVKFSKFPIDVGLELKAVLKLRLLIKTLTKRWTIWKYTAPYINRNIFDKPLTEEDKSPPTSLPVAFKGGRRRRAIGEGCSVKQVIGRDPTDPAFLLEIAAQDEVSDLRRRYAIGSHKGGNDIRDWEDMGGASIVVPIVIVNGIPLYWTVKIKNSQGLETTAECSLRTYDTTLPDGRIEASHGMSSHPHKLSAAVVIVDDSPIRTVQFKAVGLGPGEFGNTVADWTNFRPKQVTVNTGASNDLKHFAKARRGTLTADPIKTTTSFTEEHCATECIQFGVKCISFDYDTTTQKCLLHSVIEGNVAQLAHSGAFHNYERITGFTSFLSFTVHELSHGEVYFINSMITNDLEYTGYLASAGTIIDFTPPEPGYTNATKDTTVAEGCNAAVTQLCEDVTDRPNHRKIIDGEGSRTVFNGHERLFDLRYTRNNHYVSAHWDGFHDDETGIWGYTWAVGSDICGTDIDPFDDPHKHLSGKSFWTHHGLVEDLLLRDGPQYVTVQAINNVVFGGALVTTVCHSQPLIVDTTPPLINSVDDYTYDEEYDALLLYYNVSDPLSGIKRVDFGLGLTKYDVKLRKYSAHEHVHRKKTYIIVQEVGLTDGVPAWIRLRAENNVDLFASGHSNYPIMIDRTPPIAGNVSDGPVNNRRDIKYQKSAEQLCGFWNGFYDPDTGIGRYKVGFGDEPIPSSSLDTTEVDHLTKSYCQQAVLEHNKIYYTTVVAYNRGLKPKSINSTSNGVLVDITPPTTGWIKDGLVVGEDLKYTHKQAEVSAYYDGFSDPESGISDYDISVTVNGAPSGTFNNAKSLTFEKHSFSLSSGDNVHVKVTARNGADATTSSVTDGYTVDLTPPDLEYLRDSLDGQQFQTKADVVYAKWKFKDPESGVKEYRMVIYQYYRGHRTRVFPAQGEETFTPSQNVVSYDLTRKVQLKNGGRYTVKVTAVNNAKLSATVESDGIRIDTTKPHVTLVSVGLSPDDEDLADDGSVLLQGNSILASWEGHDDESGIISFRVAVGKRANDDSVTNGFIDFKTAKHGHINNLALEVTAETGIQYYITVKAINGAGAESEPRSSRPITVLRENVPGIVNDGRRINYQDESIQRDSFSLAMNFLGFESQLCNIVDYDWAIGTNPGFSDVQVFSSYGLVMENRTHGYAEANIQLDNSKTYFTTVRAITGHKCHEEFIVSVSDGIKIDNQPPSIHISQVGVHGNVQSDEPLYQDVTDSIVYKWNIAELESTVGDVSWFYGSRPYDSNLHSISMTTDGFIPVGALSLPNSLTGWLVVQAVDEASNTMTALSTALTIDTSPPKILRFSCSSYVSTEQSVVDCEWDLNEKESFLTTVEIGVGLTEGSDGMVPYSSASISKNAWAFNTNSILSKGGHVFVNLNVSNHLGKYSWLPAEVVFDVSPPDTGRVDIVSDSSGGACVVSQTYIDILISGFADEETGIDRYEVAVGNHAGKENVSPFRDVGTASSVTIDDLELVDGAQVFVTVKAFNKVGLSSEVSSSTLTVSPRPRLYVNDGSTGTDIEYQNSLSKITAYWQVKRGCELKRVQWAVYRIDGVQVKPIASVPATDNVLFDDSLTLESEKTYYVIVKAIDVLNREFKAKTDGVWVSLESPRPGTVMEGKEGDIEYQQSTTQISAMWDSFGIPESMVPSQTIVKYEVALGNDRTSVASRENVHPFIDVGLRKNYVFNDLELVSKLVRYYVTVRATSASGGSVVVSSNGILVGFNEPVTPSTIVLAKAQSNTESMKVSWPEFKSEVPMSGYDIAVSSLFPNYTRPCKDSDEPHLYDIAPLHHVGKDTVVTLTNLTLEHGRSYYVTVRGKDIAGNCVRATSHAIIVDTTTPQAGRIKIGAETKDKTAYVESFGSLLVTWKNFVDHESDIAFYDVSLYEQTQCPDRNFSENHLHLIHPEVRVTNDTKLLLEELTLQKLTTYFVKVNATNFAGLSSHAFSLPVLVDNTKPSKGTITYGHDWKRDIYFQTSLDTIKVVYGIDHGTHIGDCVDQEQFPLVSNNRVSPNITKIDTVPRQLGDQPYFYYRDDNVQANGEKIRLNAMTVTSTLYMGGFEFDIGAHEGNYSVMIKGISGKEMFTSFVITEEDDLSKVEQFKLPTVLDTPTKDKFRVADLQNNGTKTTSANRTVERDVVVYNASLSSKAITKYQPTVGFHILGFDIDNTWQVLFFAVGEEDELKQEWIKVDFNPSTSTADYRVTLERDETTGIETWNSRLLIGNIEHAILFGIKKPNKAKIRSKVKNRNDFVPAPGYNSEAYVSEVFVALPKSKPCMFGKPFYDNESKIKEVWMGIGTKNDGVTDVLPMKLVDRPCARCVHACDFTCDPDCRPTDFQLYNITLSDLALSAGSYKPINSLDLVEINDTSTFYEASVYYVVTTVYNYAAESVTSIADGITVDVTPPSCEHIVCLDPSHSMTEPIEFLGSNNTFGAYWECFEDASRVFRYTVSVGTSRGLDDVFNKTNVFLNNRVRLNEFATPLKHDTEYWFNVDVINSAELTTRISCNVTTDFTPPNTTHIIVKPKSSKQDSRLPPEVLVTNSSTEVGIDWTRGPNTAIRYDWEVETEEGKRDLLPPTPIGLVYSTSVGISGGKIDYGGNYSRTSLSLLGKKNYTKDEVEDVKRNTFFRLEPGRCVTHNLYARNRAYVRSKVSSKRTCILRDIDTIANLDNGTQYVAIRDTDSQSSGKTNNIGDDAVNIKLEGESSVFVGKLSNSDLKANYGSAASNNFTAYIQDPETANGVIPVSDRLADRYRNYTGTSFFMAPATITAKATTPIEIAVSFNPKSLAEDEIPVLIYYDPDENIWREACESCKLCDDDNPGKNVDWRQQVIKVKICNTRSGKRSKRSASTFSWTTFDISPTGYSLIRAHEQLKGQNGTCYCKCPCKDEDDYTKPNITCYYAGGQSVPGRYHGQGSRNRHYGGDPDCSDRGSDRYHPAFSSRDKINNNKDSGSCNNHHSDQTQENASNPDKNSGSDHSHHQRSNDTNHNTGNGNQNLYSGDNNDQNPSDGGGNGDKPLNNTSSGDNSRGRPAFRSDDSSRANHNRDNDDQNKGDDDNANQNPNGENSDHNAGGRRDDGKGDKSPDNSPSGDNGKGQNGH